MSENIFKNQTLSNSVAAGMTQGKTRRTWSWLPPVGKKVAPSRKMPSLPRKMTLLARKVTLLACKSGLLPRKRDLISRNRMLLLWKKGLLLGKKRPISLENRVLRLIQGRNPKSWVAGTSRAKRDAVPQAKYDGNARVSSVCFMGLYSLVTQSRFPPQPLLHMGRA